MFCNFSYKQVILSLVNHEQKEKYLMRTLFTRFSSIITLLMLLLLASCGSQSPTTSSGQLIVRLGYFPNLTHAVALVGVERGTFQQALGSNVKLETKTFNAGPALIEALFAGAIDIGYVRRTSGCTHSVSQRPG